MITRAVLITALVYAVRDRAERANPPASSSVLLADETYTYLPLAGRPLVDGTRSGKDCLALLPHLVTHQNWTLGIVETEWTVLGGSDTIASFDLTDAGQITLERPGHVSDLPHRYFYLNDHEMAELRRLNELSCSDEPHPVDHARTFHVSYSRAYGDGLQGAAIPAASRMGAAIDRILRTAAARYVPVRIEVARRMVLDLRVRTSENRVYRVHVADGTLVVKRGTRELLRRPLTDDEIVDLADWSPPDEWEGGYVSDEGWAHGSLFDGDKSRHRIVFDAAWLASRIPNLGAELSDVIQRDE